MEQFQKLTAKLTELFELEKADLDFGIHRIIKARQGKIQTFLSNDSQTDQPTLKKIVLREMGEANSAELQATLDQVTEKLKDEYGRRSFEGDTLTNIEAIGSADGQLWKTLSEQLTEGTSETNTQLEAEIYSHLTTFFSRYYHEADFIAQRRIKAGDTAYAVPYSGEEVMLHWANKDQYYIKSSKDLKDYTFTLTDPQGKKRRVQFKCHKQDPLLNNTKAKREFHLADPEETPITQSEDSLVIPFHYKIVEKARTRVEKETFVQDLLGQLPLDWQTVLTTVPDGSTNNLITRHLNNYTKKNESDFFIHKHLSKFLNQELDFYIKNEVMHLDDIDERSADYLTAQVRKIKAIRTIAKHVITFLAQLENFQKKIWLKKKYVTETNYCLSLDRIFEHAPELIDTILEGLDRQIFRYDGEARSQHEEWEKLYHISELKDYPEDGKLTAEFLENHDKLMLDTVFFDLDVKYALLSSTPEISEKLNGFLIHSENLQALNTLEQTYSNKIKSVYIDPPYNTDASSIIYKNGYRHSSWCSLIYNGLLLGKRLMKDDGVICQAIDDIEFYNLQKINDCVFPHDSSLGVACLRTNPAGRSTPSGMAVAHDYHIFRNKTESGALSRLPRSQKQIERYGEEDPEGKFEWVNFRKHGGANAYRIARPRLFYPIFVDPKGIASVPEMNWNTATGSWDFEEPSKDMNTVWPINSLSEEMTWKWGHTTMQSKIGDVKSGITQTGEIGIYIKARMKGDGIMPLSWWDKKEYSATEHGTNRLKSMFRGMSDFSFPKSLHTVVDAIRVSTTTTSDTTLDYFAGSGTTGHAVINLNREDNGNRKYILVEMGDHFDTVLKPRLQKVVYSATWKNGKPTATETGISHAFKYLRLESYEDALNNLQLEDKEVDLLGLDDSVREDYLLNYMLDVETTGHLMNLERFQDPWGCQLKIHNPHTGEAQATTIDLIETFNYLMGFTLHELKVKEGFLTLEAENPQGESVLVIWRKLAGESDWKTTTNEELTKFIESRRINLADTEYASLYVNGDHTLHDPHSKVGIIEDLFYERMFANTGNPDD